MSNSSRHDGSNTNPTGIDTAYQSPVPELDALLAEDFSDVGAAAGTAFGGDAELAETPEIPAASEGVVGEDEFEISCTCCGSSFRGFAPEQAYGCASDLRGMEIQGHYGSFVADEESYRFLASHGFADGSICDLCIIELFDEGSIQGLAPSAANIANANQYSDWLVRRRRS